MLTDPPAGCWRQAQSLFTHPNLDDFNNVTQEEEDIFQKEDVFLKKSAAEITSLVSVSGIVSELGAERQSRTGCCVSFLL